MRRIHATILTCSLLPGTATAGFVEVTPDMFLSDSTFVDFETGSSAILPQIDGVTFLREGTDRDPANWFRGSANAVGIALFDNQSFNNVRNPELDAYSHLGVAFDEPVSAIGAWFGLGASVWGENAQSLVLRAFDGDGNLIMERGVTAPPIGSPQWLGIAADGGIGRFEWKWSEKGFFLVDNMMFGDVVPEPTTLIMTLVGAVFLRIRSLRAKT